MKRPSSLALLLTVALSSAVMAGGGAYLKYTVCRDAGQLQEDLAVTVPLTLLRDGTVRQLVFAPPQAPEAPDLPDTPQPPEGSQTPEAPDGSGETQPPQAEDTLARPEVPQIPVQLWPRAQPAPVDEAYFDDALFIGDSRTDGLSLYGRIQGADYFATTGLDVFELFDAQDGDADFEKTDLRTLLSQRRYGKLYLMLGINEIGHDLELLMQQYQLVVQELRALQPDALLILCANLQVTEAQAAQVPRLAKSRIDDLNGRIAALADETAGIYYLDANPVFCDEGGHMRADLTGDGVHPYAKQYPAWSQWLMQNGIPE